MYIFIISFALVVFVSFCFFKKRFWENRYLVLAIGAGLALVATLTVNYAVRDKLKTKVVFSDAKHLSTFFIPDSIVDAKQKTQIFRSYEYYFDHKKSEYFKNASIKQVPVRFILYTDKKNKDLYLGYLTYDNGSYTQRYHEIEDLYVVKDSTINTPYICNKTLTYDVESTKWINTLSLPDISEITELHVPVQLAMIPDSLIKPTPF